MRINLFFLKFESWKDEHHFIYRQRGFLRSSNTKGFWIRIFGYGIHVTNRFPLFSEHISYKLPFGYRLKFLKKDKKK